MCQMSGQNLHSDSYAYAGVHDLGEGLAAVSEHYDIILKAVTLR